MATVHFGNVTTNVPIKTPAFIVDVVEVIDSEAFVSGHGILADLKVSLTLSAVGEMVEVGYVVINKQDRLLSYKGKFQMIKCSSISQQIEKALQCL